MGSALRLLYLPIVSYTPDFYFSINMVFLAFLLVRQRFNTMRIFEVIKTIKPIKPLTPEKARIASLQRQKDSASDALKSERNRQSIKKAQQTIYTATKKMP